MLPQIKFKSTRCLKIGGSTGFRAHKPTVKTQDHHLNRASKLLRIAVVMSFFNISFTFFQHLRIQINNTNPAVLIVKMASKYIVFEKSVFFLSNETVYVISGDEVYLHFSIANGPSKTFLVIRIIQK